MKRVIYVLALLSGCATQPEAQREPAPPPEAQQLPAPPPERVPPPRAETTAVAGLMESARADTAAGRLPNAAATLERAANQRLIDEARAAKR